jgi:hypothetical protein
MEEEIRELFSRDLVVGETYMDCHPHTRPPTLLKYIGCNHALETFEVVGENVAGYELTSNNYIHLLKERKFPYYGKTN